MTRFTDGPALTISDLQRTINGFVPPSEEGADSSAAVRTLGGYRFLFDDLQKDPKNRLPETDETANRLIDLGRTMLDLNPLSKEGDSTIPSVYTYFGQFIDHDLTRLMKIPGDDLKPGMLPLPEETLPQLTNARSPSFDLDCIYGPPTEPQSPPYVIPRQGEKLFIERAIDGPPFSDLPRDQTERNRPAFIGDRRNDENLNISQMHVAFLRAHNALVDRGQSFDDARKMLRRIYQYIVINDYLPRITDPVIVKDLLSGEMNGFDPTDELDYIPLEFSVAGFRTCHSMIRNVYSYNRNVPKARLFQLFLPGTLKEYRHILSTWMIDWPRFFDGRNNARRIGPKVAPDLSLMDPHTFDLATVDLLKGFLLRLPTGEAVARTLGETPLSWDEIVKVTTPEQQSALIKGEFRDRTPLWFYLLCEGAATTDGRLGQLGSIIVAAVIVALVRRSKDSYLRFRSWVPPIGKGKDCDLADLFELAGAM